MLFITHFTTQAPDQDMAYPHYTCIIYADNKEQAIEKVKELIKKFSCFKLDENKELLVLQENSKGYLIIKQMVEISELLHERDIIHVVYENNDIQLYMEKD